MPGHDIITIGASAGDVEALAQMAGCFPEDLSASIFVAAHLARRGPRPGQEGGPG